MARRREGWRMVLAAAGFLAGSVEVAGWAGPTTRVYALAATRARRVAPATPTIEAEPFVLGELQQQPQQLATQQPQEPQPQAALPQHQELREWQEQVEAPARRNLKNSRRRPQPASMPVVCRSSKKSSSSSSKASSRGGRRKSESKLLSKEEEVELAAYVERLARWEGMRRELNETLGRAPSDEEWAAAAGFESTSAFEEARHECGRAKATFVSSNLPLVVAVAKRYRFLGSMDYNDLLQEGTFGLTRAVERFDASRGYRFSTYAVWWIRQAISAAVAEQSRVIRLPPKLHRDLANLEKARRALEMRVGREPTDAELAAELDLCATKVEFLKDCGRTTASPVSLHSTRSHHPTAVIADLLADRAANPVDFAVSREVEAHIAQLLQTALNPTESTVLSLSFGLAHGRPRSLDQIAALLDKSPSAVRAIKARALNKLRQPHSGNHILKAHYQHY